MSVGAILGVLVLLLAGGAVVAALAVGVSLGGMKGGYAKPSRLWFWRRGS